MVSSILWRPLVHGVVGLFIVLYVISVISSQVSNRSSFASSELRTEVMDRWGAPIVQPAPSVRFVESGSVFKKLQPLPLASQDVRVEASMNYRKRGLVYFSGFDFRFEGRYTIANEQGSDLDVAFVFPINLEKNKVLLSDLTFAVDGAWETVELAETANKLTWTGRLEAGATRSFEIGLRGRGLESFTYSPDPALPVRDFSLAVDVQGGDTYDYADGVVAAQQVDVSDGSVALFWEHASLESGVPVGLILPATKSFDRIIGTILRRSFVGYVLLAGATWALALAGGRTIRLHEAVLVACGFASLLILLPYLAAYLHFYVALVLGLAIVLALLRWYLRALVEPAQRPAVSWVLAATVLVPTVAVVLEGYTGLIYTIEIVAVIVVLMRLTTAPGFRRWLSEQGAPGAPLEESHAS